MKLLNRTTLSLYREEFFDTNLLHNTFATFERS